MSRAIDALVEKLAMEIRGRMTAEINSREKTNLVAQLRQDNAKLCERVAELEAMPVAFEKADVGNVLAEWVDDHDCREEGCYEEEVAEYDGWGYIDPATGQRFTRF